MRRHHLRLLAAPDGRPLRLVEDVVDGDEVLEGALETADGTRFPVRGGIPRFVQDEGYTVSFGQQWHWYRAVQLESDRAQELTRARFREATGWTDDDLRGRLVLEAGCGAGRFTRLLAESGAEVYAFDYSGAVDACRETVDAAPNVFLAQGDLTMAPFRESAFDRVLSLGVLQHTPDPRASFLALVRHVKPGGEIAVDVYRKRGRVDRWGSKYWVRPLTSRLPPQLLRRIVEWYVPRWLPIDTRLARVPRLGRFLSAVIPCWNYTGMIEDPDELRAWAVLDTFDALSPRYDQPQTIEAVEEWVEAAGLIDVDVRPGGNGILARGRRPV